MKINPLEFAPVLDGTSDQIGLIINAIFIEGALWASRENPSRQVLDCMAKEAKRLKQLHCSDSAACLKVLA